MKRILHKILVIIFFTIILFQVLSYLSVYVNPAKFYFLSFFGLAYPFILIAGILFAIYWLIRKRYKLLYLWIFTFLIGFSFFTDFFQFDNFLKYKPNSKSLFKLLSYNVKQFDLYNWENNKKTRNKMFKLIENEDADIICLQEFYYDITKNFKTLDTLVKFQKAKNYYVADAIVKRNTFHFGIVTFSKYPIINSGEVRYKNTRNFTIFTDVLINDDTIRIFNNHLQSIKFGHDDYTFIDSLNLSINKSEISGAKNIFRLLKIAFQKRAHQVNKLSKKIKKSPYPVIVCGDFNATPISYTYHKISSNNLIDAFCESGVGISSTYIGKFPSFRIDYILYSKELQAVDYTVINKNYSDHKPISCKFIIK
ncbi:MAG: hypothetical protein DRI94_14970 [Bacteroidetes bacterium]|nr:MAG: hypothetical protein DRI94_14970 [Bacteroidota bacterium]